jgi:molybdenum cofactor cytidylyltransferase
MHIQHLPLDQATGHLLLHNVVDADGRRLLRKGVQIGAAEMETLRALNIGAVEVATLDAGDVWEDDAARQVATALEGPELSTSEGVGGRINLHTVVHGVLYVDEARLVALNQLPGITLATRPQHAIVKPERGENRIATLKIIPYAIPQETLDQAMVLVDAEPPLLAVRPLSPRRLALLIVGDPAAHLRLLRQFELPTRERLLRLNSDLEIVEAVPQEETAITAAVRRLLPGCDGLILAGQTSIMDQEDMPLRSLRAAGAEVTVHGAPVDPGNLLALGWMQEKPILCAPGCARSPARNVMDLVLPRILTGDRLTQSDVAAMSLGGLLEE